MLENVNLLLTRTGEIRSGELASFLGISRQAAHKHLSRLVDQGILERIGEGRGTRYRRIGRREGFRWETAGLSEDLAWRDCLGQSALLSELGSNAVGILQYAFTELVNNAIDHSGSEHVEVGIRIVEDRLRMEVIDSGIGIFEKLRRELGLTDTLHALQEVSKGKVTTWPEAHTGEGIFFVSKIANGFEIDSGGLRWVIDQDRQDMTIMAAPERKGTLVRFELLIDAKRRLEDLFRRYAPDSTFSRTRITVKLFEYGVRFVSRSEAKRLLAGLEKFSEVILDFSGVESVGQGFCDEVIRVWPGRHPNTAIRPVAMNEAVGFMVRRASGTVE